MRRQKPVSRTLSVASIVATGLAVPAPAWANTITAAEYGSDDQDVVLTLTTVKPVEQTRVRSEAGAIRVWLGPMDDVRLNPDTDGQAVRKIRIRPGAGESALVHLLLRDRRSVDAESVRITQNDVTTQIRIARSALPEMRSADGAAAAEATPEEAVVASPAPIQPSTEPSEPPEASRASSPETAPAPAPAPKTADKPNRTRSLETNMAPLALVTLLLGVLYFVIRIFVRARKPRVETPDIELLSSKRLGPRHQLLLVRALGEDHLLSVNAGQTERITSMPAPAFDEESPEEESAEPALAPAISHPMRRSFFGHVQDTIRNLRSVSLPLEDDPHAPSVEEDAERGAPTESMMAPRRSSEPPFGADLLKFAEEAERRRTQSTPPSYPPTRESSEAIAGLIRLRNQVAR